MVPGQVWDYFLKGDGSYWCSGTVDSNGYLDPHPIEQARDNELHPLDSANTEMRVVDVTLNNPGTGYTLNEVLTLSNGTFGTTPKVKVTGVLAGAITSIEIHTEGRNCSVCPADASLATGSAGANDATFDFVWGACEDGFVEPGRSWDGQVEHTSDGVEIDDPNDGNTRIVYAPGSFRRPLGMTMQSDIALVDTLATIRYMLVMQSTQAAGAEDGSGVTLYESTGWLLIGQKIVGGALSSASGSRTCPATNERRICYIRPFNTTSSTAHVQVNSWQQDDPQWADLAQADTAPDFTDPNERFLAAIISKSATGVSKTKAIRILDARGLG